MAFKSYNNSVFDANDIMFYDPNGTSESETGCSDGEGSVSVSGGSNAEKILNFFIANGLTAEQAAGLTGNIKAESGFSPTRHEGGITSSFANGGWGLVQWTNSSDPRRDRAVEKFRESNSALIEKYYNADYGTSEDTDKNGGVPLNYSTKEVMPIADNDALLVIELNYILQEAKASKVSRLSQMPGNIDTDEIKGLSQWDAIKKQTSVKNASDVWLWSYEYPADISAASILRASYGESILSSFGSGTGSTSTTTSSGCTPSGEINSDKVSVASQILANSNIELRDDPLRQVTNISNKTSTGSTTTGAINIYVLNMINALGKNHKVLVTSINRYGEADAGSSHPSGSAVDIARVDGLVFMGENEQWDDNEKAAAGVVLSTVANYLLAAEKAATANGRPAKSAIGQAAAGSGQVNCGADSVLPNSLKNNAIGLYKDTCHHMHISVPIGSDPSLSGF